MSTNLITTGREPSTVDVHFEFINFLFQISVIVPEIIRPYDPARIDLHTRSTELCMIIIINVIRLTNNIDNELGATITVY